MHKGTEPPLHSCPQLQDLTPWPGPAAQGSQSKLSLGRKTLSALHATGTGALRPEGPCYYNECESD